MSNTSPLNLRNKTNAGDMVSAVKAAIMSGEFSPGQRLVEAELMMRFDAGRGAVREALRRLSETGLLVIEPNKGASVRRSSRKELADTFDIRAVLEGQAASQAAHNLAASGQAAAVEAALEEERSAALDADATSKMAHNERLHGLIVSLSGNQLLPTVLSNLMMPELRAVFFQGHGEAVWRQSRADHITILEAILEGKTVRAQEAMHAHVMRTADLVETLPPHYLRD